MDGQKRSLDAIGIDLGTANSAAAVALSDENPIMVSSRYGNTRYGKTFPSYVLFDVEGTTQRVGQRAKEELSINPKLVVWGTKRLVGLTFKEACKRNELDRFQYDMSEAPDGSILIATGNKRQSPAGVLEIVLREIRTNAENPVVNETVATRFRRAVIGVPAYFMAIRAGHIIEAGHNAGFEEVDTIAESTAAALRYSVVMPRQDAKLLVFDMGAGTLDVTLVQIKYERQHLLVGELAIAGDEWLGGMDMDDLLTKYVTDRYSLRDIDQDPRRKAMLKEEIENVKIRLSRDPKAQLDLPKLETVELTREEMQSVLMPVLERCRQPIRVVLSEARIPASEIRHVLFVGGPTHMPCVRATVRSELQKLGAQKMLLEQIDAIERDGFPVDPLECVAQGAAMKAAGVLEPIVTVSSEGYGTVFPVEGSLPYYKAIIKHNAFYPVEGRIMMTFGDPRAKVIYFDIVAKRPDPHSPSGFRYDLLGWQPFFIQPTGRLPWIDVRLGITNRKELITDLVHFQTNQRVAYRGLNLLQGEEIELQEDKEPGEVTFPLRESEVSEWTAAQLERLIQVANGALDMVPGNAGSDLQETVSKLHDAIDKTVSSGLRDPNAACPMIGDRILELIHGLFIAKLITQDDRQRYASDLAQIAGGLAPR